jgi:site-specific recombinase XerD
MLTLYRRHSKDCPNYGQPYLQKDGKPGCPVWVRGIRAGKPVKESLHIRSWDKATQVVKSWEGKPKIERITVEDALNKYYDACKEANLSPNTLKKYRTFCAALGRFARLNGIVYLGEFRVQEVRDFLKSRRYVLKGGEKPLADSTLAKELERTRTCFRFFEQQEWIDKNPARIVRPPKVRSKPRLPFEDAEVSKILGQCETPAETAFVRVLRHSGLRITDAALLQISDLQGNRICLRTTKADVLVHILLPSDLVEQLNALPRKGKYLFLIGESEHPHTVSNLWRRRIQRMCKAANISPDHPHRFRHTLAKDLLLRGASVEDVAMILGNSPAIVIKFYSQWIPARQAKLDSLLEETWSAPRLVRVK